MLRRAAEHLGKTSETGRLDAELLLAHALGRERIELYTDFDRPLSTEELDVYRELVARRSRREPVAYILGEWGFRRLTLTVDRRALIPRPETEIVVERALGHLRGLEAPASARRRHGDGGDRARDRRRAHGRAGDRDRRLRRRARAGARERGANRARRSTCSSTTCGAGFRAGRTTSSSRTRPTSSPTISRR